MESLNSLAMQHGTDKNMGHHGFTDIYEQYFGHLKHKNIKLLEIGVKRGASVKMWRDYFTYGEITGIDIVPDCQQYEDDRIKIHIGTQISKDFLGFVNTKEGNFDIIVDDGSHKWYDQIFTFEVMFPMLNEGGIYVIEDLHTSFDGNGGIYGGHPETCQEYLQGLTNDLTKSRNRNNPPVSFESVHFHRAIAFIKKK